MCQTNSTQGSFLSSSRQPFVSPQPWWLDSREDSSGVPQHLLLAEVPLLSPPASCAPLGPSRATCGTRSGLPQEQLCPHWTPQGTRGSAQPCSGRGAQTRWVSPGLGAIHLTPIVCSSGNGFASPAFAFQPCDFSCSRDPTCPVCLPPDWFTPSLPGFVPKCPGPFRIRALANTQLPMLSYSLDPFIQYTWRKLL